MVVFVPEYLIHSVIYEPVQQQLSATEVHLLQRQKCYNSFPIQKLSTNSTEAKG